MAEVHVMGSGQRVTVSPSDRVVVVLEEKATAGYEWMVERVEEPLTLESSTVSAPSGSTPGAAARRRVVFAAGNPGDARVTLVLRRSWEEQPRQSFEFCVIVR
jgi:predicted secreted protein